MADLQKETRDQVKRIVSGEGSDVNHELSRTSVVEMSGFNVESTQQRILDATTIQKLKALGATGLATPSWFNAVTLMEKPDEEWRPLSSLMLDVVYPIEYFDERPQSGLFRGEDWLEQYGSVSGFGNGNVINTWSLSFVAPNERVITNLSYPKIPDALEQYNDRFKQYLDDLDTSDPTIVHYRSWAPTTSADKEVPSHGLRLMDIRLFEVLHEGSKPVDDHDYSVVVSLVDEQEDEDKSSDVRLTIDNGGNMVIESWWEELEPHEPSQEVLTTALHLLEAVVPGDSAQ